MQTFKDTVTQQVWQFNDDVIVTEKKGVYSFACADGTPLTSVPTTLQPYTIPAPTPAELLAAAQKAKVRELTANYNVAIHDPVVYKSVGNITETYQADNQAISNLQNMLLAFAPPATLPTDFYWVAQNNTHVPFTYADLQGLAVAIGAQGFTNFDHLQDLKTQVAAATTVAQVNAITW